MPRSEESRNIVIKMQQANQIIVSVSLRQNLLLTCSLQILSIKQ